MNSVETMGVAWLKLVVTVEYLLVTYFLLGIDNWWGLGLTLVLTTIIINIKSLYIMSILGWCGYLTFTVAKGVHSSGGWGASIVVGGIVLVISLAIHAGAFLDLEEPKNKTKERSDDEDIKSDEVA
ncbi:hypothetical protein BALOs_2732 [Halobacteriovorax sp. BALOs_7]|uniref:hypothetical protein n=1 Tax=Halobacteriovorax sp. BALOs_7 TaxID=2109558 RepID=UPI000EA1E05D|nr:hypothetical protein [Halobacteriovorax sp. BALOs_7]AYF45722.1 hypothetical protein BALOs_2732 [Halobacteriovorax sp. BALOs_7]